MSVNIRIHRYGGPEVLQIETLRLPPIGADEVRIHQTAIGLNYIDTYHRSGLYPRPLPTGIGLEAAGVVEAVGSNVTCLNPGDRIAYAGEPIGAYATERILPTARLVKLPDDIDSEVAASVLLKGLTAYFLLHLTFRVSRDTVCLVHAAAGGVGSLLVPWAKNLGAIVIGTAGGPEKCRVAKAAGCDSVIDYRTRDFVAEVKRVTDGEGVDVVYDSVGRETFDGSLSCLKRRGLLVSFGNASGKPPPIDPALLSKKGSLYLTRPTLGDYISTTADLAEASSALFDRIRQRIIRPVIGQRYFLREAAKAHADLEARKTIGATLLIP